MLEWRTSIFHKFLDITCVGHCCHFVMVVTQSEVQVHIRNQSFCAECRHVSVLTLMLFLANELNSLYYLGGYVVSPVKKNDVTCESCMSSLLSVDCPNVLDSSVTKLVILKEYSSDSLVYCGQSMFDLGRVAPFG